jgi:proline dehydrogenase
MSVMRKALLAASTNPWLRDHVTKWGFVRRSVTRFMPGERIEDALQAAKALQKLGINAILTHLGENLTTAEEFEEVTRHYLEVLDKVAAAGLDAHISIKPTQLGLDFDRALCERNMDRLVERAEQLKNFVWIDMEGSPYVDPTIEIFKRSRAKSARVGIAIQAYLYRTPKDIEAMIPLGSAIRMVKGAYLEPPAVAYPKKSDVDDAFYTLCTRLMAGDAQKSGTLLHIGTHDSPLTDRLIAYSQQNNVPKSAYELAMLYGIQRKQQLRLAKEGQRLRVLISYGEYWFPWYMRRLAERPANVWFVIRTMFG